MGVVQWKNSGLQNRVSGVRFLAPMPKIILKGIIMYVFSGLLILGSVALVVLKMQEIISVSWLVVAIFGLTVGFPIALMILFWFAFFILYLISK